MNSNNWTATILLLLMLFGTEVCGQSQERYCQDMTLAQEDRNRLQHLFRYAQMAERPKHDDNQFMVDCPPEGKPIATAPRSVQQMFLTGDIKDGINRKMTRKEIQGALLEEADTEDGSLSIECTKSDGSTKLPIRVKINVYYALIRDFFSLEFSFSSEIIDKDKHGNITNRSIWAPYLDKETNTIIYGMRGTDPGDMKQILTNYVGNECAFPATKIAVSHVCHVFKQQLESNFERNSFGIAQKQLETIRSFIKRDNIRYSTVLTGHSLGGHAAQYIAQNPPQTCLFDSTSENESLRAYAFASTRNPPKCSAQG